MSVLKSAPFSWINKPAGVSWIKSLDRFKAREQCLAWGLQPAATLEENRVILRHFIDKNMPPPTDEALNTDETPPTDYGIFDDLVDIQQENSGTDAQLPLYTQHLSQHHMSAPVNDIVYVSAPSNGRPPLPVACMPNSLPTTSSSGVTVFATHQPITAVSHSTEWLNIVQSTATAVGESIAAALSRLQPGITNTSTAHVPQALNTLINALPICSGSDSAQLLKFSIGFTQICELKLADEKQIVVAMLPKTAGQLRAYWLNAITQHVSTSQLMQGVLDTFLPDRARQQLITDTIYRVQKTHETLADFITDVQNSARILLDPSTDLLDIILTGINAQTRARLAGFPAPYSVDQLLQLVPRLEVIRTIERQSERSTHTPAPPQTRRSYYHTSQQDATPTHARDHFRSQGSRSQWYNNNNSQHRYPIRPNTREMAVHRPEFGRGNVHGNYRPRTWHNTQQYRQVSHSPTHTHAPRANNNASQLNGGRGR